MNEVLGKLGLSLARYLSKPTAHYEQFSLISEEKLLGTLEPCDLLLVEGKSRISTAIKYLTQSTWSHVAIYIGQDLVCHGKQQHPLLEADLIEGVRTVPIDYYHDFNVRICRPINLQAEDKQAVIAFVCNSIGYQYDTKNIFDLLRYLLPTPPVPERYRRQLISLGSGDPTKAICSTLIAQAFQHIHYPILPRSETETRGETATRTDVTVLRQRHYSHFTPRDFDLSPYFDVVKPTVRKSFNYKQLKWQVEEAPEPQLLPTRH